jgi:hypothetical protein
MHAMLDCLVKRRKQHGMQVWMANNLWRLLLVPGCMHITATTRLISNTLCPISNIDCTFAAMANTPRDKYTHMGLNATTPHNSSLLQYRRVLHA